MADGDVAGLQWERTRLAWIRTSAAAASLEAAVAVAVIHARSVPLLWVAMPGLLIASGLLLAVYRDLRRTQTPWHPTARRTFEQLVTAFVALAVIGLAMAVV